MEKDRVIVVLGVMAAVFLFMWVSLSISVLSKNSEYREQLENLEELVEFYQSKNLELQTEIHELKKGG